MADIEEGLPVTYDGRPARQWVSTCLQCGHQQDTFSRESWPKVLPCLCCGGRRFRFERPPALQYGLLDFQTSDNSD